MQLLRIGNKATDLKNKEHYKECTQKLFTEMFVSQKNAVSLKLMDFVRMH